MPAANRLPAAAGGAAGGAEGGAAGEQTARKSAIDLTSEQAVGMDTKDLMEIERAELVKKNALLEKMVKLVKKNEARAEQEASDERKLREIWDARCQAAERRMREMEQQAGESITLIENLMSVRVSEAKARDASQTAVKALISNSFLMTSIHQVPTGITFSECVICQRKPKELLAENCPVVHLSCDCHFGQGCLVCQECAVGACQTQSLVTRVSADPVSGEERVVVLGPSFRVPPTCPTCRAPWALVRYVAPGISGGGLPVGQCDYDVPPSIALE